MRQFRRAVLTSATILVWASAGADAQPFEQAGVRAQGMAGAFVAVADDASAVWWNPAGLASGPFFNLVLERQQQTDPDDTITAVSLAALPLGVAYQHVRYAPVPAAAESNGRQTSGNGASIGPLVTHEAGVTLLHSVTANFVVGSTVKFIRGVIDDRATNQADLDLGVHYRAGHVQAGVVGRNLAEPSFKFAGPGELTLDRQVRGGLAWVANSVTVAADLDLTEPRGTRTGRRLAFGAEKRSQRWALRGGVRVKTTDAADPWGALGASYAVKPGVWIDGFWGDGEHAGARWGVSGRLTY